MFPSHLKSLCFWGPEAKIVFVCEKGRGGAVHPTVDDKYTCTISEVFIRFFVALTNLQIFFTNILPNLVLL